MAYRVASVPYINAAPLAYPLELGEDVEVMYAVPSALPALLDSGEADAILVSGVYALTQPDLKLAGGVAVASRGPVTSVKIFSHVPLRAIQTLALDAHSMTSNRLALEILAAHGSHPATSLMPPDYDAMLAECDACVLIGDVGMAATGRGALEFDMGSEWLELTGLPFLWAGWIGRDGLTEELATLLVEAGTTSGCGKSLTGDATEDPKGLREAIITSSMERTGFSDAVVRDYLMNVMVYRTNAEVYEGYREYARRLRAPYFPTLIGSTVSL